MKLSATLQLGLGLSCFVAGHVNDALILLWMQGHPLRAPVLLWVARSAFAQGLLLTVCGVALVWGTFGRANIKGFGLLRRGSGGVTAALAVLVIEILSATWRSRFHSEWRLGAVLGVDHSNWVLRHLGCFLVVVWFFFAGAELQKLARTLLLKARPKS